MKSAGWTICTWNDSDTIAYEADLLVCRHCGLTIFMCDSATKRPLPASAVAERCNVCDEKICGLCKFKMNNGEICTYFRDRIDREEYNYQQYLKLGAY